MTAADMAREAARIVPPINATAAIAVVDEQLHYRAAFLVGGRIRSAPVGPAFERPRDAIGFVDLLNGETDRAPRPVPDPDSARADWAGASQDMDAGPSEAPVGLAGPLPPDPAAASPTTAGSAPHPNPTVASQAASG